MAWYERSNSPLDLGPEPARIRAGTRVSYVPAAAIVCRVDALREIGGFDESLRFGEDVDLVWRLDEAGWRCRYEPAVRGRDTTRARRGRHGCASGSTYGVVGGPARAPPSRRAGPDPHERLERREPGRWRRSERPIAGSPSVLGSAAALIRKLPDVPAAGRVRPRRPGQPARRRPDRQGRPPRVVAARSPIAARALAHRRAGSCSRAAFAARHPVRLADDVAYSIGVWRGIVAERTLAPLVPEISSWPGRRPAEQTVRLASATRSRSLMSLQSSHSQRKR